jgi:cell division protein FtsQ
MSARLMLAAGIVAGMAALAACFGALYWLLSSERFPVTQVELKGNLRNTTRAEIEAALPRGWGNEAVNFFAADLTEVRAGVERLPWVRRAAVRRVWPGRLELWIEEHVALARWSDDRLVNIQGETFSARSKEVLPVFAAPAGTSAEVARRYRRFAEIVAPLDTKIDRVVLSPRHAWQLRLANGQQLMLGRDIDAAETRLRQFVEIYPRKFDRKRHEYVDLRYPNGFALRVPESGS